ncbi:Transposase [Cordylochernes scorpioides]|uniref:Transposase n=1 Tax=Cordylochernes scorpioides TaxID=51811 RepID=A0ABY6KZS4_9ARAC|nr:Transposase [Cordylochernes scorpioides]
MGRMSPGTKDGRRLEPGYITAGHVGSSISTPAMVCKLTSAILLLLAVGLTAAQYGGHHHGHHHDDHYHHHPHPYHFGYHVKQHGDHHHLGGTHYRKESGDGHGGVHGSYGYVDEHGVMRHVDYVADHHGFRAHVRTNEPGTANQDPAAVHLESHGHHEPFPVDWLLMALHSGRPLRKLPLTPPNRCQHLEWCRARSTWMTEWHRVVFSDESRFCLSSDSRRVRVWRRRGERSNPAAIVERPTVRQRGIMVWGAIAYDSRSPLLRIQGTMTAQRYVDDVLRPVTLPYLHGVHNALYQQDNARPHTARISQQALQDVQMLPWPPYSPDLSPIEHVWDIIGRRLHALPQPRSEDELWQMVEREWRAIPQDAIRTLIDSLPRRVAACIAVRGGPTCY